MNMMGERGLEEIVDFNHHDVVANRDNDVVEEGGLK